MRGCQLCHDKQNCKHRCCKIVDDAQGEARVDSLESLRRRAEEALAEDLKLALELYGKCVYLHLDEESYDSIFNLICKIEYIEQEKQAMQQRIDEGDAVAMYLVAEMTYYGRGGYPEDWERAFSLYSKASSLGHVYSTYMCGICFQYGRGVTKDLVEARRLFILAADQGCRLARIEAANMFEDGRGGPEDFFLAALYYQRCGFQTTAEQFIRDHRMEVAPWSRWTPTVEVHHLVPPQVHQAMLIWTLISKRIPIPKHLDMMVTRYIITRDGW